MCKIKEFLAFLEQYAPLELSYKMIEKGGYDNSGIIVNSGSDVQKVLFSLDLNSLFFATKRACKRVIYTRFSKVKIKVHRYYV